MLAAAAMRGLLGCYAVYPGSASWRNGNGLMDTAYGNDSHLRAGMTDLGVPYVAGILPNTLMWRSGTGPRRKGKPLNNTGRRDEPDLVSAKEVVLGLPKRAWRAVKWREGSADWLSSRFARVRVSVGHNKLVPEKLQPEWLLVVWPEGEKEPTRYWLSTLPKESASGGSSILPSCAGASSVTIRSSSKRSDLGTYMRLRQSRGF
jgi:SRSO17 transposase